MIHRRRSAVHLWHCVALGGSSNRRALAMMRWTALLLGIASLGALAAATPTPAEPTYSYQEHPETSLIDFEPQAGNEDGVMKLVMMHDKGLSGMGAVCLDGSDAGFYFSEYSGGDANKNKWQLYFQGGGWYVRASPTQARWLLTGSSRAQRWRRCYDEMDCWGRSHAGLGSSKTWPKTASEGGIMSADCKKNPVRVLSVYCSPARRVPLSAGRLDHLLRTTATSTACTWRTATAIPSLETLTTRL
jgi:hypothetical protein